MTTIVCKECGNEVEEGAALNGYCPRCVDKFQRREKANLSPIVNAKTGKLMTQRGLKRWWKKPVTYKDLK